MTAQAIVLRPLGTQRSVQIAAVLAACFAGVILLAMLAVDSRTALRSPEIPAERTASTTRHGPALLQAPAGSLQFHVGSASAAGAPAPLLDAVSGEELMRWQRYLREHPADRLLLTLASAPGTSDAALRRVGAALVRLLAGKDLNPHRLRLALALNGDVAAEGLNPGDFRLSLELGTP